MYFDRSRYADWHGDDTPEKKRKFLRFPRICATCRHLELRETGREFPAIIDTEYTVFSCRKLGWETKEFYLMKPVDEDLKDPAGSKECPHWEPWTEDTEYEDEGS